MLGLLFVPQPLQGPDRLLAPRLRPNGVGVAAPRRRRGRISGSSRPWSERSAARFASSRRCSNDSRLESVSSRMNSRMSSELIQRQGDGECETLFEEQVTERPSRSAHVPGDGAVLLLEARAQPRTVASHDERDGGTAEDRLQPLEELDDVLMAAAARRLQKRLRGALSVTWDLTEPPRCAPSARTSACQAPRFRAVSRTRKRRRPSAPP